MYDFPICVFFVVYFFDKSLLLLKNDSFLVLPERLAVSFDIRVCSRQTARLLFPGSCAASFFPWKGVSISFNCPLEFAPNSGVCSSAFLDAWTSELLDVFVRGYYRLRGVCVYSGSAAVSILVAVNECGAPLASHASVIPHVFKIDVHETKVVVLSLLE